MNIKKMQGKKAIYNITHSFFCNFPSLHVRRAYYRLFMKHMGKDCYIAQAVDIREPLDVSIGDRVVINKRVVLDGRGCLEIKNDVDIAQDVYIWTEDHDMNNPNHTSRTAKVVIEDHVWIASRATVLPGVRLGRGCVVASGAVVSKDVEMESVVGGIPAKMIKKRENPLNYKLYYNRRFWEYK